MTDTRRGLPRQRSAPAGPFGREPRIGILVVAYNAATTLARTLDRIPESFRERVSEVFVCDDASQDGTYRVGLEYQQLATDLPVTVVHHQTNLGYGGNQKAGYRLAMEHDLDIVVLLHADGQYAPECLPEIVAPLERGEADAVFGSRMMVKGSARAGGMPAYKFVGNRILTAVENRALGSRLSEFHSGYRAYNVHALADLDLSDTADGFNFDTQIIIALLSRGKTIVEIPIPTFYGDEICYVNGLQYAADVLKDVAAYRLATVGFTRGDLVQRQPKYDQQEGNAAATRLILGMLDGGGRALQVGCSGTGLVDGLRGRGYHVTGVDLPVGEEAAGHFDEFVPADVEGGLPGSLPADYDIAIAADVLEHVRDADMLLQQIGQRVTAGGTVIISVPNFGHWYPRLRTVFGVFDYDQRGILDKTHVRFFTRRSLLRMVRKNGFTVTELQVTGTPLDVLGSARNPLRRAAAAVDRLLVRLRPTLFGYQFVLALQPRKVRRSVTYRRDPQQAAATATRHPTPEL